MSLLDILFRILLLHPLRKTKKKKVEEPISLPPETHKYGCGHKGHLVVLDCNELSVAGYHDWAKTTGYDGDKSQCWDCYVADVERELEYERFNEAVLKWIKEKLDEKIRAEGTDWGFENGKMG